MDSAPDPAAPVSLFYSYAHEDEPLRDELQGHLKLLERRGLLAPWHDRQIVPGSDWSAEIDANLRRAELVLLLVSKDFINSDYIMGVELAAAMERHAQRLAVVIPIVVRAVDLNPEDAQDLPFLALQGLPTDLKPVTSWPNRDEAWTNVAKGLRASVKGIRERRPATPRTRPGAALPSRYMGGEPEADDAVLERVIDAVVAQVDTAQSRRSEEGMDPLSRETLRTRTRALVDVPDQKRVLWVDDHPAGNRLEVAALNKLQIEIVTALGTAEALQRIDDDAEPFDLVISDWERPGEGERAGLVLLERLRAAGHLLPVVYYHGAYGSPVQRVLRVARATQARLHGAVGEAVLPDELMALVLKVLGG